MTGKAVGKVDSKIIRKKTGFNQETRIIMENFQKQSEEIKQLKNDIKKYTQDSNRLNSITSNNSEVAYRPKADWDSSKKLKT